MQYIISRNAEGDEFVTVFPESGAPLIAGSDHPNYAVIRDAVQEGTVTSPRLEELFDVAQQVAAKFERYTERVSVANGRVYVDGDELHGALANQILRFLEAGLDVLPLVKFLENLLANPNEHSQEQLYEWLDRRDFAITDEGHFVGYKGVRKRPDGTLVSKHHGKAIVNGEAVDGAVPNEVGSIVEFPRSEVNENPAVGCSTGLHVGDYDYAKGWAEGALLRVDVNPRDVVSVPTDCNAAKVRVCRYEVIEEIEDPIHGPLAGCDADEALDAWEDEEDGCPACGDPDYSEDLGCFVPDCSAY